jgi:hypothetical protein
MKKLLLLCIVLKGLVFGQNVPIDWNYRTSNIIGFIGKTATGQDTVVLAGESNLLPVKITGDITIESDGGFMNFTRTFSANASTTVQALPSHVCRQVDITVDFNFQGTVFIGSAGMNANTGIPLRAGDAITFYVRNTNEIYFVGTEAGVNVLRIKYSGRE